MKRYNKNMLVMPAYCVVMDDNVMEYIEGGKPTNLPNSSSYLSRSACMAKAKSLKSQGFCVNMTQAEVAKEIHGHAIVLYWGVPAALAALATGHPLVAAGLAELASHGADGIYLGDNPDSAPRVAAYNAVWVLGSD